MAAPPAKNGNGNGGSWIWPSVVAGVAALINAFWVVVWGTVNAETTRLQREIDKLGSRIESTYTKRENTEQYRQRVAVEIGQTKQEIERVIVSVRRLRDDSLSKESFGGRHEALIDELKRQNTRVDELRRDFGGAYSLSDKIKELQDQLKALQVRTYNTKSDAKD